MQNLDDYEQKLLDGWEDVYKKGQLTLWIMLALKDGDKHMAAIKDFITTATNGTLSADDQSMYRALRRYYDAELVDFTEKPGKSGPDRKVYSLTGVGLHVLQQFLDRNITSVFYTPKIEQLIKGVSK
jgi:PadR family transcriptional regulator, regulatory protein PadR